MTNSEDEDISMEWNQRAQCGEQALCTTDRTRQTLIKHEAQFKQDTVIGLMRKTDKDPTGSSRGTEGRG